MKRVLILLTLFITWDRVFGGDCETTCCNTIWRCKEGVYKEAGTYAGGWPTIPDEETCMATCSRSHECCTGYEYRKRNCWIHCKPITPSCLKNYAGSKQCSLIQRCHPDHSSAHWHETVIDDSGYLARCKLSDYDKGVRMKCLCDCVARSSDYDSSPCTRVFFCPSTGGSKYEPYGSCCTLLEDGDDEAPEGCYEYKLVTDRL